MKFYICLQIRYNPFSSIVLTKFPQIFPLILDKVAASAAADDEDPAQLQVHHIQL